MSSSSVSGQYGAAEERAELDERCGELLTALACRWPSAVAQGGRRSAADVARRRHRLLAIRGPSDDGDRRFRSAPS